MTMILAGPVGYAQTGTPEATTRIIDAANGQVEIPVHPERTVALDSYSAAAMADIGVVPVGVPEFDLDGYMFVYKEALADIPTTGPVNEPDLEAVLLLEPDLILCITAPWGTDNLEALQAIAPTVLADYTVPNAWKALTDIFADAAGAQEGLDKIKEEYANRIEELRTTYQETLAKTTWAVAIGWGVQDGMFSLYFPDSPPGAILTDLGVTWVDAARDGTGGNEQISLEEAQVLETADVILTYGTRDGEAEESSQTMLDTPGFQNLPAVKNDHVYIWRLVVPASYGEALVFLDQIEGVLQDLA